MNGVIPQKSFKNKKEKRVDQSPSSTREKLVDDEKTIKLLKLIKHNEYSMVDQLNKTLSRILLLFMILRLEPHHKSLIKSFKYV